MSIDWDDVLVTNDPNQKEIVVSFPGDGFGSYGSITASEPDYPGGGAASDGGDGDGNDSGGVVDGSIEPENVAPEETPVSCGGLDCSLNPTAIASITGARLWFNTDDNDFRWNSGDLEISPKNAGTYTSVGAPFILESRATAGTSVAQGQPVTDTTTLDAITMSGFRSTCGDSGTFGGLKVGPEGNSIFRYIDPLGDSGGNISAAKQYKFLIYDNNIGDTNESIDLFQVLAETDYRRDGFGPLSFSRSVIASLAVAGTTGVQLMLRGVSAGGPSSPPDVDIDIIHNGAGFSGIWTVTATGSIADGVANYAISVIAPSGQGGSSAASFVYGPMNGYTVTNRLEAFVPSGNQTQKYILAAASGNESLSGEMDNFLRAIERSTDLYTEPTYCARLP